MFEDVTEEFSDMTAVLQHFESWRNRDMGSYKDTYFSLCLPKVRLPHSILDANQILFPKGKLHFIIIIGFVLNL